MPLTVLVTRAQPGAAATARRIAALGHEPVLLPLSRTVPVDVDPGSVHVDDRMVVAVTSAAALRHASPELLARLVNLRCFAVGESTAVAARAAGFSRVETGPGHAEGLAPMLLDAARSGSAVLLCGRTRRDILEAAMAAAGLALTAVETYRIETISYSTDSLVKRLSGRPVAVVLIHATAGIDEMLRLSEDPVLRQYFDKTRYFCLSQRIAATLRLRDGQVIAIAARPDEDALLSLLDSPA